MSKFRLEVTHSEEVRQVAAIYLKNLCKKDWNNYESNLFIPDVDNDLLKVSILTCFSLSIPYKIRRQFEKIAKTLRVEEYSVKWMHDMIQTGLDDPNLFYATLNMMYKVCKANGWHVIGYRSEFEIMDRCLPKILEMFKSLVSFANIECFDYVKLIEKIYFSGFRELYFKRITRIEFDEWMICFQIILEHPIGDLKNRPESKETKKYRKIQENLQCRCKKWATKIVWYHFISSVNQFRGKYLVEYFRRTWAAKFFNMIIQQLFQINGNFFSYCFLPNYLKYITESVEFLSSRGLLDERMISDLSAHMIMLIMNIVKSDHELWKSNPIEFIKKM